MTQNLNAPEPVEKNLLNQFEQYRDSDKACPTCRSRILMFRKVSDGIEYQCNCGEEWHEETKGS